MEAFDSFENDPEHPYLTSERQPLRNMNEANREHDDHDMNTMNLDLTIDVPLPVEVLQSRISIEKFISPCVDQSPP
ncbi:hypothetical protein HN51_058420 [Arachis hypogaea]